MTSLSLSQASDIYSNKAEFKISHHDLENSALEEFDRDLHSFRNRLGLMEKEDFWIETLRPLISLRFLLFSCPLDKEFFVSIIKEENQRLKAILDNVNLLYPSYAGTIQRFIYLTEKLIDTNLELHLQTIIGLRNSAERPIGLLVKNNRNIDAIINRFRRLEIEVVNEYELKKAKLFKTLIIVGPCPSKWYPAYVISSPRASIVHVVKYKWLKIQSKLSGAFIAPFSVQGDTLPVPSIDSDLSDSFDREAGLPEFDYAQIIKRTNKYYEQYKETDEFVEATICNLQDDKYVFLDVNSDVLTIDPEDESDPIDKLTVGEISVGLFILLRTSGGGDFIVSIADTILEDKSVELRFLQKSWKNKLRTLVASNGAEVVVNDLNQLGSKRANLSNLRNWMSYRTIKTEDYADFSAIINLIKLEENPQEVWEKMRVISSAHTSAGFQIRERLIRAIKITNYSELVKKGVMEFHLPEEDAGSFTAFRVVGLSNERINVSPSDIGVPYQS